MTYTFNSFKDVQNAPEAIWEGLLGEGAEELGEGVLSLFNPDKLLRSRTWKGDITRLLFSIPEKYRIAAAIVLSEVVKKSSLSPLIKRPLAGLLRGMPDGMLRMLENGYKADFEAGLAEELADEKGKKSPRMAEFEQSLEDDAAWQDPVTMMVHRSNCPLYQPKPPEGVRVTNLLSIFRLHGDAIGSGHIPTCRWCIPELPTGMGVGQAISASSATAANVDFGSMSPVDQRKLALVWRILNARLEDKIDRPRQPHALKAALERLNVCPAALKALSDIEPPDEDKFPDCIEALQWLERADVVIANDHPMHAQRLKCLNCVEDVIDIFAPFEVLLRAEARGKISTPLRLALTARDWIDDSSTATSRASFRNKLAGWLEAAPKLITEPSWTRTIVIILVTIIGFAAIFGLPVVSLGLFAALLLFAGLSGAAAIGGLVLGSPMWLNLGVIGLFIGRLLIPIVDGVATVFRGIKDFLDPSDGTGLVGGSIRDVFDALRHWGILGPKSEGQEGAQLERASRMLEPIAFLRERALTVTIVGSVVAAGGNAWLFLNGQLGLVLTCLLVSGWLTLMVAELYTRGWRMTTANDDKRMLPTAYRQRALKIMINTGSMLAAIILVFGLAVGGLQLAITKIAGERATTDVVVLARGASEKAVAETAKAIDVPLTERDARLKEVCAEYKAKIPAVERKNDLLAGGYCRQFSNEFPCDCDAALPESVLARHPELQNAAIANK